MKKKIENLSLNEMQNICNCHRCSNCPLAIETSSYYDEYSNETIINYICLKILKVKMNEEVEVLENE